MPLWRHRNRCWFQDHLGGWAARLPIENRPRHGIVGWNIELGELADPAEMAVRRDLFRAGMSPETEALIEELNRDSAEFCVMWAAGEVLTHGEGIKRLRTAGAGELLLEFSTFAVDSHPDLGSWCSTSRARQTGPRCELLAEK